MLCLVLQIPFHGLSQNRPLERGNRPVADLLDQEADEGEIQDGRDEKAESSEDRTPLGVDLASIHLISDQNKATMLPSPGKKSIVIEAGLPAPNLLSDTLEPFIGEPLSMALLSDIAREVVLAWRESDYPLVDVYYPEQNITQGKLQIVVKEALLGEKRVEGARRSREDYLLKQLRVDPGDRISQRIFQEDLDWLNQNPARHVNVIYDRGELDATSDIIMDVDEEKVLSAYMGFANTGVAFTGEEEWSVGFNLANPLQTETNIGYHFATDFEWQNLAAHSVVYQSFLPWRHTARVFGAYVLSSAEDTTVTDTEGLSRQLSFEYQIPLPRPKWSRKWRHHFTFAFHYKSTDTDLLFGGATFFNTEVEVGQLRGQYGFSVPGATGITQGFVGVVSSPGDIFRNNDDASFNAARFGSEARYWYGFGEIERMQKLPQNYSLRIKVHAQSTTSRLNATEQLLAGGYRTVRGYDESVIRGDSGVLTTVELITPEFAVSPTFSVACDDRWNAFVFYDAAALQIEQKVPGEISPSLQSVGVGLHCRLGDRGFARASYGWAVQNHGLLPTDNDDGKLHFGVTLTY